MSGGDNIQGTSPLASKGLKLCSVVKRPDFDGYGFSLHSEKAKPGQFIGKVDDNSPASEAGLKQGDRIIEVNGVFVENETHKQVVQRIKAVSKEVRLLLIDVDADKSTQTIGDGTTKSQQMLEMNSTDKESQLSNSSDVTSTIICPSYKHKPLNCSNKPFNDVVTSVPLAPSTALEAVSGEHVSGLERTIKNDSSVGDVELDAGQKKQQPIVTSAMFITQADILVTSNGKTMSSLELPVTAAEMRSKLMSKKKYDPKTDSVDLKKKFEIVQKL